MGRNELIIDEQLKPRKYIYGKRIKRGGLTPVLLTSGLGMGAGEGAVDSEADDDDALYNCLKAKREAVRIILGKVYVLLGLKAESQ